MKIIVATISHDHGTNSYAAKSEEGIWKQLAEFCREWWQEAFPLEEAPAPGLSDHDLVLAYFEAKVDEPFKPEYYNIDTVELED